MLLGFMGICRLERVQKTGFSCGAGQNGVGEKIYSTTVEKLRKNAYEGKYIVAFVAIYRLYVTVRLQLLGQSQFPMCVLFLYVCGKGEEDNSHLGENVFECLS